MESDEGGKIFSSFVTEAAHTAVKSTVTNVTNTNTTISSPTSFSPDSISNLVAETSTSKTVTDLVANMVTKASQNLVTTTTREVVTSQFSTDAISPTSSPASSLFSGPSTTSGLISTTSDSFNIGGGHQDSEPVESMQDHINNLNSPRNIQYLIQVDHI